MGKGKVKGAGAVLRCLIVCLSITKLHTYIHAIRYDPPDAVERKMKQLVEKKLKELLVTSGTRPGTFRLKFPISNLQFPISDFKPPPSSKSISTSASSSSSSNSSHPNQHSA